jgi:type II secretory pathway pseudopilin PulG
MSRLNKLKGFTLAEVIIVTACLAVVIGLSVGDVRTMLEKQQYEQERLDLEEIKKALEIYAEQEGTLPSNTTLCQAEKNLPTNSDIWTKELAKYSKLTSDRICFDMMGNPRQYNVKSYTKSYFTGAYKYNVYYATVTSDGVNRINETPEWTTFDGASGFTQYNALGDDLVVKFTDKDIKTAAYEKTIERIAELEKYLERYARSKRASARSLDIPEFDKYIMYPKDGRGSDTGSYLDTGVTGITSDLEVESIGEELSAVELTKILGVPEYLGENAMTGGSLWYISNPGPDREIPCSGSRSAPPYYPPAIIVTTNDNLPTGC